MANIHIHNRISNLAYEDMVELLKALRTAKSWADEAKFQAL